MDISLQRNQAIAMLKMQFKLLLYFPGLVLESLRIKGNEGYFWKMSGKSHEREVWNGLKSARTRKFAAGIFVSSKIFFEFTDRLYFPKVFKSQRTLYLSERPECLCHRSSHASANLTPFGAFPCLPYAFP